MKCPRCQAENPAGQKFCGECGVQLASVCAACGTSNPPGQKFCGDCGTALTPARAKFESPRSYTPQNLVEKILTSKAALEGERKQVTVLFADLKGSMELLADRDPEEARRLLDPVLEHMIEAVHCYEGTVNQIMGDGIMALFGAPLAHEDHAVRACYAALRMQESVKKYADELRRTHAAVVKIRVGLNSGEVVVRAIGSDLHTDYTAVGLTTHLAARMEQLADPGAIVITRDTLALVEGYVDAKSLGPVPVKGLADAMEIYEVTGAGPARTRLQAAAGRGLTRFVGRDAEMEQLGQAQQRAAGGHGQIVAVVAEAGVGKSRLVHEVTHSHHAQNWLVLESASVPYGTATSYLPVIDLLKGYFKIQDRDELEAIRVKVTGQLLTLDASLKPTLPALLALLDAPVDDPAWQALDPGQRRQRTLDAVQRLLMRQARERPLLLIFEDLHWIDGETQALLDRLVDGLGPARLLLLVNYRPEYQHGWSGKTYYSQMRLSALPAESAGALLDALLGDDPGLASLKQRLVKRGNPFFLEETVRTLVETKALAGERGGYRLTQPVQTIQVPPTVQVMLAARIDRLAAEHKRLLQVASVVGKVVPFTLLQEVADLPDDALRRGLDQLQAAEFVHQTGLYPDLEYSFKHTLTHEVTYGGLLHARRRELHARLVDAIETLYPGRLDEHTERLAHHAFRGELREKAVRYLRQAGLRAAARSALVDARAWLEQALGVLAALPESQSTLEHGFDIRLDLRPVLNLLGEVRRAQERLREAEAIAERLNDDHRRGLVSALMTNTHSLLGELDAALASGGRALRIAASLGDSALRGVATAYLEQAHYYRADYERVIELAADDLGEPPADRSHGSSPRSTVGPRSPWLIDSFAELGRFAEAARYEAEAIRLAEATHSVFAIGMAHASRLHLLKGDWAKARSVVEQGIAAYRAGNMVLQLAPMVARSVWVLAQLGETSEALNRLGEGEQLLGRYAGWGVVGNVGTISHALGRACLLLGRLADARRLCDQAIESSSQRPGVAAHALHLLGDVATHPDRFDAEGGEGRYRQALVLAEPRGMRPLVAHCHFGLGRLYRHTGKRQQARDHLATARAMYREMDMRFWLDQLERFDPP